MIKNAVSEIAITFGKKYGIILEFIIMLMVFGFHKEINLMFFLMTHLQK